jgi:NADH-quinone oxidoreductase subunit F
MSQSLELARTLHLLMANPHVLIEGCIIACHAIRAKHAFIYIRGEITHVARRVNAGDC